MATALHTLKRLCLEGLGRTGVFNLVANSAWRRQRLLILCYHGVSTDDEHLWNGALYMSPAMLEDRLRMLSAARCTVLPLGEGLERLYAGTLPERSVAISFDDGYSDFVTQAYPLLTRFGYATTVYLPTLRCGPAFPVFALAASYVLWKAKGRRVHAPEVRREPLDLRTAAGRDEALAAVNTAGRRDNLSLEDKNQLVAGLAGAAGIDYGSIVSRRLLQIMTPAEVTRLAAEGVDFELHTHTHRTPHDRAAFLGEIEKNRARIRELTGRDARHFCYPSGNYAQAFLPWLAEAGVISATTCDSGLATRSTSPLLLPRLVDTSTTAAHEFEGWLSGTARLVTPTRSYADRPH
ncbi:MAG: polysaccharide deacetylase family protein [Acidobacteria bacterium]|nr:polysaccharide deacetylase family protein [Acidobacteriota bacterium]